MATEDSPAALAGDTPAVSSYRTLALIIASALFMEQLDATVLATAIPTMAHDFHVRAPQMSVALTAYLLALALFIPASGHAADRWGAKNVFRAAIGVFMAGSLACAVAPDLPTMVVSRFAQGIGGAMMVPVGRLVLLRTVSKRDLVAAYSWMLIPGIVGQISGPPIGGFIVTYLHWRWIFRINLPIGIAGILLVGRFIPDFRETTCRPFDWSGFTLAGIALSAALFGFETSGHGMPIRLWGPLLITAAVFGLLYVRHAARTAHPLLDLSLLSIPTF